MGTVIFPEGRRFDIVGLGRLCIDLNANEINRPMEETLTFTKYVGGSPANITIAMARLGMKTGFIGKVSDDAFGRFIRSYLVKEGIDTSMVATDRTGAVTGLAFTEIKSPTECSILMYRDNAADLNLDVEDIDEEYIRQSKALLVSGTALSRSPSREAAFRAAEIARKHGTVVILDIDYRPYSWKSRSEAYVYYRLAAEKSDVIFGGREEFDLLESVAPLGEETNDFATAKQWFQHKARLVVVKHGGDGAIAFTADGTTCKGSVFPANVVKTFGAGDSFAGAFVHGMIQGWPVDRCLMYGSASASIVVSSHSCSESMPSVAQIESVIEKHAGQYRLEVEHAARG